MNHPAPIDTLPAAAQIALHGTPALRMMVARGMAPLAPVALVSALYALAYDPDEKTATLARASLEKLPPSVIDGALGSADLPAVVLDDLAARLGSFEGLLARVVQHPLVSPETVEHIAHRADEALCELIATNEKGLLEKPAIIEALYMNRALRMSTADRIVELAARNGVELRIPGFKHIVAALQDVLIPEAGEITPADEMFRSAIADAEEVDIHPDEDVVDRDEEGEEALKEKFKKVEKTLLEMNVSEKIRIAQIGTPAQRMLLVRSANRVVAMAAIGSPKMQEGEAVSIAASRQVGEDILRFVANKRDWTRMHRVKVNLCFNPKTPVAATLKLVLHLREGELKLLARSKNVPQALKTAVTQLLDKRSSK
ncbi:MAG: hypothetical protein WCJ30_01925 [Deltaproteobacteria bacterium]